MIPLSWYIIFAGLLFCVGLYGALARRNALAILMAIEIMLNAVNLNLVAFWRYISPERVSGQVFALIVFAVAASEAAVGLALIISIYRKRKTVAVEEIDMLKW
ncbi:MAG: NADH-quinone oxidoreductase subunit NuoK [Anaerolineales bacterium]